MALSDDTTIKVSEIKAKIQEVKDRMVVTNYQLPEKVTTAIINGWQWIADKIEAIGVDAVVRTTTTCKSELNDLTTTNKSELNSLTNSLKSSLDDYVTNTEIPKINKVVDDGQSKLSQWVLDMTESSDGVVAVERTARINADNTLQANIDAETTARKSADSTLTTNLSKEISDRKSADTALETKINQEIADRQTAISESVDSITTNILTLLKGIIVMWSGTIDTIPNGWVLCNGSNGTPDLTDKFVMGAGKTYSAFDKGGQASITLTAQNMPKHNHSASISISNAGGHTHNRGNMNIYGTFTASDYAFSYSGTFWKISAGNGRPNKSGDGATVGFSADRNWAGNTSSNGDHSHTGSCSVQYAGEGTAFDSLPPYYCLAFIMKS